MKKMLIIFLAAISCGLSAKSGLPNSQLEIQNQTENNITLNFRIGEYRFDEMGIDDEVLMNIELSGVFLPNDEGMPNLPGFSRMVAIPQNSRAELIVLDFEAERIPNIDLAPAPRIPLETEDGPLEYLRNEQIYSRNEFYPANPVQISAPTKLRGIDVITVGITPFQYNPVSKELITYRNISFELRLTDGNGHFGEDRLRSRWWEPILQDAILNYPVLPEIDFNSRENNRDGAEYLIICPNDATFLDWADSIKTFRQQQGISTLVVTTTEVGGNTVTAIENYVDNAYNNWSTPPAAVLLLGDYGTSGNTIISHLYSHPGGYPDFASDNRFADVSGNDLPDIVFARITANNAAQLQVMISKFLDYERNPPTDPNFYDHPITALGWQDDRWFQICSEVVGGFFSNSLNKTPIRINALGNPANNFTTGPWSTAPNTNTVMNYFGPSGLGYITSTPQELGGFTGGIAADVVNAINGGSFLLQHRDHGSYTGWGEPDFQSGNINSLTNTGNKLPFIFSINCQTGAFHRSTESFTEKFHRYTYNGQNSGALGLIAATEVSYSFVNDTYVWGLFDNLFPDFMPNETTEFPVNFAFPAFGNAAGKYFLAQSSWPSSPSVKQITYRLFHHHGDAFSVIYWEVPQNLTVTHDTAIQIGASSFEVTTDNGSFIALTKDGEIIATADGTGYAVAISIPIVEEDDVILVTITKQNYFRYEAEVPAVNPAEITVSPSSFSESLTAGQLLQRTLSITNDGLIGSVLNYQILIVEDSPSDNISGSTFTSSVSEYEAGTTFDIVFTIYNGSNDVEWLAGASLDFPEGVTVNSSTNFTGGSGGDLVSNGATGNGANLIWSDGNGSWGNIYDGESATATVNITVGSSFDGEMSLLWTLSGDNYGFAPHTLNGTITIMPLAAELTLTSPNGGEIWAAGSSQNITWNHSGAALANVKLELSVNSGSSYSDIIASTLNDELYEWAVPEVSSTNCLVRISNPDDPDVYDVSNAVFRIYESVDWLSLDQYSGSVNSGASDNLTLTFDSAGLAPGTYNANIEISSNDLDEPLVIVPVSLIVSPPVPDPPANVQISIDADNLTLSWDAVPEAQNYKIYAADSPDGAFELIGTSAVNSFELNNLTAARKFYRITADSESSDEIKLRK